MLVMMMILHTSTPHHQSHEGKVLQKLRLSKQPKNQVSYYDKLLDACESAAAKRGRIPFVREVGTPTKLMLLPFQNHVKCVKVIFSMQTR